MRGKQRLRAPRHPFRGWPDDLVAVAIFERENQIAPRPLIEKRRTPVPPRTRMIQTDIANERGPEVFAAAIRQRRAAGITARIIDKRRVAPAGGAKAEITFNLIPAMQATRRVNNAQCRLNSHAPPPMVRAMTQNPILTDRSALTRNRRRAGKDFAHFLHDVAAEELHDRLSMVNRTFTDPALVTGHKAFWRKNFDSAQIIADDDTLDLAVQAHDLVIHAMALHWANDPVGQLVQARRALRPDGLFLAVFFGGQTLSELRAALAQAESEVTGGLSPRIAPMGEIRDLGGLLQRAGFALPVADSVPLTVTYKSAFDLMRDLRAMGEGNALHARMRRPTRRALFTRAAEIYAQHFAAEDPKEAGRIKASFELTVLTGWAPDASQQKPLRPGSAAQRLADALGSTETPLEP